VFIILGAIIIAGSMVHLIYLDLILGLLVVGVGAAKLAEEITDRRLARKHAAMNESISYLTRQVDSTTGTAERLRDASESRFFRINNTLKDIDERLEDKYDDAVKKVISLENRLNEHSKLMLELAKRQEAIKERQDAMKERQDIVSDRLRRLPRAQPGLQPKPVAKPTIIRVPEPKPATILVPRMATVPEKKIMRFELPRIAPRVPARAGAKLRPKKSKRPALKRKAKRRVRAKTRMVVPGKTIINIAAPKPQVIRKTKIIKKIVRVKPKKAKPKKARPKKRPIRAGRTITAGRTIININAPRTQVTRKVVRGKKRKSR